MVDVETGRHGVGYLERFLQELLNAEMSRTDPPDES